MPHLNDVRLTLRSCSPPSMNATTSRCDDSGRDEVGVLRVVIEQRLLKRGELEEVALLRNLLDLLAAGRTAAVHELRFGDEHLVDRAIPAFVLALVDEPALPHTAPQLLRRAEVPRLGRPDEVVV